MTNVFNKKSGFTLIELLVVISIIGLLSSIVLASLNSARLKAQDARVIGEMNSLRTAAEMYRLSNNGQYSTIATSRTICPAGLIATPSCCSTDFLNDVTSGASTTLTDIRVLSDANYSNNTFKDSNNVVKWINVMCGYDQTNYVIIARLPSSFTNSLATYACIDSTGVLKTKQVSTAGVYGDVANGSQSAGTPTGFYCK